MRDATVDHPVLLIPGPTEVHPDVAAAATTPMIGHRGQPSRELIRDVVERVRPWIGTTSPVLPLGCSATGAMEASIRNLPTGRVLHLVNGAFSERWSKIRATCGREGDDLVVDWGAPVLAGQVSEALDGGDYVAVTMAHSETSTGVLNPLADIAATVKQRSDVLLMVDAVTSMTAVPMELDRWGVDLCFTGSQKALALPPGLTLCTVSSRYVERAREVAGRGFYFDLPRHVDALAKWETPTTPPLSLIFQLQAALHRMESEGPAARFARHRALQATVENWVGDRFGFYARDGFRSPVLSVLRADAYDVAATLDAARARGWWIGSGYGPTKADVIRVGHLGEIDVPTLERGLDVLDSCLVPRSS